MVSCKLFWEILVAGHLPGSNCVRKLNSNVFKFQILILSHLSFQERLNSQFPDMASSNCVQKLNSNVFKFQILILSHLSFQERQKKVIHLFYTTPQESGLTFFNRGNVHLLNWWEEDPLKKVDINDPSLVNFVWFRQSYPSLEQSIKLTQGINDLYKPHEISILFIGRKFWQLHPTSSRSSMIGN